MLRLDAAAALAARSQQLSVPRAPPSADDERVSNLDRSVVYFSTVACCGNAHRQRHRQPASHHGITVFEQPWRAAPLASSAAVVRYHERPF